MLTILVATVADVSIGKMLIAGIIPGGLLTGMFLAYVLIRVRLNPRLAPDVSVDLAGRTRAGPLGADPSQRSGGFICICPQEVPGRDLNHSSKPPSVHT